jgi:hypothetical protein
MSRYILIHRLRVPAFLLLAGVVALLHQLGVINHFWSFFWPLLLILLGVLMLAERAALAAEGGYPPSPYPGPYPSSCCGPNQAPYPGPVDPASAANQAQSTAPAGTASDSAPAQVMVKDSSDRRDSEGDQS